MSSPGFEPEEDNETKSRPPSLHESSLASKRTSGIVTNTRAQNLEKIRSSLPNKSIELYSDLLADTARKNEGLENNDEANYNVTQDGIVIWTPREKNTLFQVLDRKGKDGIKDIARAIGSKSELEVQEYIRLLHKGVQRQHFNATHTRTVSLSDIPAATELSEECCEILDQYAHLFSLEEQVQEDCDGRKRHKDLWIIDSETAETVETRLESQNESSEAGSNIDPAAELLNTKKWVRLSERFFMNFGGAKLEDNWVNVAFEDETPSITADAFTDFYALAVSITRRLVQTAIWFAISRIQRTGNGGHLRSKLVKACDVRTTLKLLNMEESSFDFWTLLARRCSLDVVDIRHRKGWESLALSYKEAERILSNKEPFPDEDNGEFDDDSDGTSSGPRARGSCSSSVETQAGAAGEERGEYTKYSTQLSDNGDDGYYTDEGSEEDDLPFDPEDSHAEALDQQASRIEELQYWSMLEKTAPEQLTSSAESNLGQNQEARKPKGERKTIQELTTWRDQLLYRGDWEEYGEGSIDLYTELSSNRRKRRRLTCGTSAMTTVSRSPESSIPNAESTSGNEDITNDLGSPMEVDNQTFDSGIKENTRKTNAPKSESYVNDTSPSSPEHNHESYSQAESNDENEYSQFRHDNNTSSNPDNRPPDSPEQGFPPSDEEGDSEDPNETR